MEFFLNRYRNLTVLLVAILAQLVLLAYQVKSNGEVRLIRVWAVSAVTPLARVIEAGRSGTVHFFRDYFVLLDVREENQRIKADLDRTKMENQYLRAELSTADRAKSLAIFQQQSPSKTIAAHVIGNTTGVGAKVVIVDRGTGSGVQKGMAVITPDGIVGKVTGAYPTASYVLLITDPIVRRRRHFAEESRARNPEGPGLQHRDCGLRAERAEGRTGRMVLYFRRRPYFPQGPAGGRSHRGAATANRTRKFL